MDCVDCGFTARNAGGLARHRQAKHPQPLGGLNAAALERTLAELRRLGRIEEVDAARIQSLRSIAAQLDENSSNSQMWREYRDALNEVLTADDDADDELASALAAIERGASVGDTPQT